MSIGGILCISFEEESQSLETLLLMFIVFMSMDCDSLTSLLLSMSGVSLSKVRTRVEDVSSMISIGIFRSVDWRVLVRGCCASDLNSGCYAPLSDCCTFIQ